MTYDEEMRYTDAEAYYHATAHRIYHSVKRRWDGAPGEVILTEFRKQIERMRLLAPMELEEEAA